MLNLVDFVLAGAPGRVDLHHITLFTTDQATGDGRVDAQLAQLDVGFIVTDDLVHLLFIGIHIDDGHGGTEDHLAGVLDFGDINDLRIGQLAFNIVDTPFAEALLLTGSMVFRIFLQVAMLTGLGDGSGNARTVFFFQFFQFLAQGLGALRGHRYTLHSYPRV